MPVTVNFVSLSRTDGPVIFPQKAADFSVALEQGVPQFNALEQNVNAKEASTMLNAASALSNANIASAAATTAQLYAAKWVSDTTYTEGYTVWSPLNFKTYRRKTAGSGTTDPANDNNTVWAPLMAQSMFVAELIQRLGVENNAQSLASLGGGVVIAGTAPTGQIYRSTDSGATWSLIQRLGVETYVFSLASLGGGVVIAGTGPTGQIYKSTDSGATWSLIQRLGVEDNVPSLASLGGGVVIAGTSSLCQIYRTSEITIN